MRDPSWGAASEQGNSSEKPQQWGQQAQGNPSAQWAQQPGQPQEPWGQVPQWNQPGQWNQAGAWNQPGNSYVAPPKPGVIALRPLTLGDFLDGGYQATRRNAGAMLGNSILFQFASMILTLLITAAISGGSIASLISSSADAAANRGTAFGSDRLLGASLGQALLSVAIGLAVSSVVSLIITMLLQGILAATVVRSTLNLKTSFGQAWRLARSSFGKLALLALIYSAAILIYWGVVAGLVVLLFSANPIAGVLVAIVLLLGSVAVILWVGTKLSMAPTAVVIEKIGPITAIRRSWALTNQNFWRILGITLLVSVIAQAIASIVSIPVSLLASLAIGISNPSQNPESTLVVSLITQGISFVISALVSSLVLAFVASVTVLLYLDLRMRKEGLDLQLLKEAERISAQELETTAAFMPAARTTDTSGSPLTSPYGQTPYSQAGAQPTWQQPAPWPSQPHSPNQQNWPNQSNWSNQQNGPNQPSWPNQAGWPAQTGQPAQPGQPAQVGQPIQPIQPAQPPQPEQANPPHQPSPQPPKPENPWDKPSW